MRRTATAALAVLLLALPARAAGPQVTDPRGDANYTGTGTVTDPASLAAYDIVSVRWYAAAGVQRATLTVADADPAQPARYVLHAATPACDTVTLEWSTGDDTAVLRACKPRQVRWLAPPVWSGDALTFAVPVLPSWFAAGTSLHGLAADAAPVTDLVVGELYPPADTAASDATYVLGS